MRRAIAIGSAIAISSSAMGQDIPQAPVRDALMIRAVRDDLSPKIVRWLAEHAEPVTLEPAQYPDLPEQTAEDVISALCGQLTATYWTGFLNENRLDASFDPRAKLGSSAHRYRWPACFFVRRGQFSHVVQPGENAALVYSRETGSQGKIQTYSHFFAGSGIRRLDDLDPGDVLRFDFRTGAVPVIPRGDLAKFTSGLAEVASGEAGVAANILTTSAPSTAMVQGEIVTEAREQGTIAGSATAPADCVGREGPPFDVKRVSGAFGYRPQQRPDNIQVVVVDNGFFGASRANGKVVFGDRFAGRFFRIYSDANGNETIGPSLSWEPGRTVSPFNRENGFASDVIPDAESGHGTHVVGLITGSDASTDAVLFDPAGQHSWLQVSVVAFSPGKRTISNYTVPYFDTAMRQIRLMNAHIVNMSIRFGSGVSDQLRTLVRARPDTLFVVAAGNEGANLNEPNSRTYPAMLGSSEPNVLTVGAEDGTGNLTVFTNRGADVVDLVAPGCNLPSSLDGVTETQLSGTSQAAPLVTLASALLARQGYSAEQIKRRLVQSGDLVTGILSRQNGVLGQTAVTASSAVPVRSRSRLNIAKAQLARFDYLRYRDDSGTVVEAIGTLGTRTGPPCGRPERTFQDVVAFKRLSNDSSGWCFWRNRLEPDVLASPGAAQLDFEMEAVLDGEGKPRPKVAALTALPLAKVDEFLVSIERADLASGGE